MPYRICKSIEIESGHQLSKHPDVCRFPHGHTRKVELILEANELDSNDMVCDFKAVKEAIADYLQTLDHALCVNTQDPHYSSLKQAYGDRIIDFHQEDPTTEVMARTIYQVLAKRLALLASKANPTYPIRPSVHLVKVRVWETSSSWAEFEGCIQE